LCINNNKNTRGCLKIKIVVEFVGFFEEEEKKKSCLVSDTEIYESKKKRKKKRVEILQKCMSCNDT